MKGEWARISRQTINIILIIAKVESN